MASQVVFSSPHVSEKRDRSINVYNRNVINSPVGILSFTTGNLLIIDKR